VIKDSRGKITELHCSYDPQTKGGNAPDGRKVKGTIHWVSAAESIEAEVRLYDRLFSVENPNDVDEGQDFKAHLNSGSMVVLNGCRLEPFLKGAACGASYQFERKGYFCLDGKLSKEGKPVFNRTVSLKDTWAKIAQKNQ